MFERYLATPKLYRRVPFDMPFLRRFEQLDADSRLEFLDIDNALPTSDGHDMDLSVAQRLHRHMGWVRHVEMYRASAGVAEHVTSMAQSAWAMGRVIFRNLETLDFGNDYRRDVDDRDRGARHLMCARGFARPKSICVAVDSYVDDDDDVVISYQRELVRWVGGRVERFIIHGAGPAFDVPPTALAVYISISRSMQEDLVYAGWDTDEMIANLLGEVGWTIGRLLLQKRSEGSPPTLTIVSPYRNFEPSSPVSFEGALRHQALFENALRQRFRRQLRQGVWEEDMKQRWKLVTFEKPGEHGFVCPCGKAAR